MNVLFATLADAANVSQDGKLNILGMFGQIAAPTFPATHARMVLVMRLECTRAEFGVSRAFKIALMDADGKDLCQVNGSILPPQIAQPRSEMDVILPFENLVFPAPGAYRFDILIGDDHKRSVDLGLNELAPVQNP